MTSDWDLLGQYARDNSQDAFAEIVRRHLDLVYSAALRQVRSPQLAEEIAQSVFADLARNAGSLARGGDASSPGSLTGWLYQVTRRTAIDVIRKESRRRLREQIAVEMNDMNATESGTGVPPVWSEIEPLLDEAMDTLDDADRAAVLLRYFENKSLREVGEAIGASEDAAQKRVSRAVERLREFFAKRGVAVGASGLAAVISANAVEAAPVGLAATISAAAALAGTAVSASTVITATKTIAMTTLQKTLVTATIAALAGAGIYEAHQAAQLREQNQILRQQQAPLAEQIQKLQRERGDVTNRLASLADELARAKKNPSELLRLRGEVGALRTEKAIAGTQSALNKMTANPESRKALRDTQRMGMNAIYSDLVKRLNLPPEQADQFNDLLADHVMDCIDLITQALHDSKTRGEIDRLFSAQNSALQDKLLTLVGPDGLAQYQDYTKNLLSTLTVAQFAGSLTGDQATIGDKKSRLLQALQAATQSNLAASGLPADYQTVPMLNFANIASEEEGAQSLHLMDSIYGQVAASAGTFLNADELNAFQQFRTNGIQNNQTLLLMNRKMMAPIAK